MFPSAPREKSIKTIQDEIRSVIRQITATVTFLPLLDRPCESAVTLCSFGLWVNLLPMCHLTLWPLPPSLLQVRSTSWSTRTKIWLFLRSGRSQVHRSSANQRRCACVPSPPPSTKWTAWWRTRGPTPSKNIPSTFTSCTYNQPPPFVEDSTLSCPVLPHLLCLCPPPVLLRTPRCKYYPLSSIFSFFVHVLSSSSSSLSSSVLEASGLVQRL